MQEIRSAKSIITLYLMDMSGSRSCRQGRHNSAGTRTSSDMAFRRHGQSKSACGQPPLSCRGFHIRAFNIADNGVPEPRVTRGSGALCVSGGSG